MADHTGGVTSAWANTISIYARYLMKKNLMKLIYMDLTAKTHQNKSMLS